MIRAYQETKKYSSIIFVGDHENNKNKHIFLFLP